VRRHVSTDAAHAYGGSSPRSPRGASTTRSRTRACRSARSRSTPPARATRQGRDDRVRRACRDTPRPTTTRPTRWPCCTGRPPPRP
jgi:hypothetical protein